MSVTLNINGTGYSYPEEGDENWGGGATDWATAVTNGMLQKAGGTFTLTADVNFGGSFGLVSKYFVSRGTNPATVGAVRLANAEVLSWRDFANSANLSLAVNASDELTYNGTAIVPSTGIFPTTSGGTGLGTYTAGDTIYYASGTAFTKLAIGAASAVMVSTGTAPSWVATLLVASGGTGLASYTAGDTLYYASGTALSKLAIGAANSIKTSTGSAPQWVASLITTQGGTGLTSYTAGDMLYYAASTLLSKLAIGSANTVLTSSGSAPQWSTSLTLAGGFSATTGAFSSVVGILGGNNASIGLWINAASLSTSSTDQYGIISQPISSSSATVAMVGIFCGVNTAAAAFTCAIRAQFQAAPPTKGAGSTITRDIAYYGSTPGQGTNNAFIADNAAFSGSYFINSTDTNASLFSGVTLFSAGLRTKVSTANTANPPTKAELTSAFGAPGTVGTGFVGILDDNGGHTNEYICWSDGTEWFYATGTKAA